MTLTITDFFCGAGGSSQGMDAVPGVQVRMAANHWQLAVDTHATNFPAVEHDVADISQVSFRRYPRTDLLWASPECTNHSIAQGRRHADAQPDLFGEVLSDAAAERSRATMWDVPRYLEAMTLRGRPTLAGVVENVVDVRRWVMWDAWVLALRSLGYRLSTVSLNSMFAHAWVAPWAPQSRDRLYVVYWRESLGRRPNLEKWTRPHAHCPQHGRVRAVQAWRNPSRPWGRYRAQYLYRCPRNGCRREVAPSALAAASAIDWSHLGTRIGDRDRPLTEKTLARIRAGLAKYGHATTANEALVVPVEGRSGKEARPASLPLRTQTTRAETGVAVPPLPLPSHASCDRDPRAGTEPLTTVAASGSNHALLVPAGGTRNEEAAPASRPFRTRTTTENEALVVPYYGNGAARPTSQPVSTVTTLDRHALVTTAPAVEDCHFRMLQPAEIQNAMAFARTYQVLGNRRERVRQLGNAVTPPAAEVIVSALVEAITGETPSQEVD